MTTWTRTLRLGLIAGILSGIATSAVAALGGRRRGSAAAALNAPSHIVHREDPARVEAVTARHTLVGVLVNTAATVFWATLFGRVVESPRHRSGPAAIATGAAGTAVAAYVTDYYVVPRKLRPGYERQVGGGALFGIYAALALSLAVAGMVSARR